MRSPEDPGSGVWAAAERASAVRETSAIEHRRAEILALIAKLQRERARAKSVATSAAAPSREPVSAQNSTDGLVRDARAAVNALGALRDLERRVAQLEQSTGRPRASQRPPAPQRPEASEGSQSRPSLTPPREQMPSAVISGVIQGQLLSDVLQLVSSNSMTGIFTVECRRAKTMLYFDEGRIVHAAGQGLEGEQAFFSIFGFDGGRYHFEETTELSVQRTINSNTQFLILEALRQIDESRAE